VTPGLTTHLWPHGVVDALPGAIIAPLGAAGQDVQDSIDDLAHVCVFIPHMLVC
jgi:hypothetical protein